MLWKERPVGVTAEVIAGVMKSFWVDWPETFFPNIAAQEKYQESYTANRIQQSQTYSCQESRQSANERKHNQN